MAGPPPAALLIGAAAAFFLLSKKKEDEPKASGSDDNENKGVGEYKPPKAKTQEELKDELEADDEDQGVNSEEVIAEAAWKRMAPGADATQADAHNVIWASDDCESALIGRDWKPVIEFEGKLYDPGSFWTEFAEGERPNKKLDALNGDSNVSWFTERVFNRNHSNSQMYCDIKVPKRSDFSSEEAYGNGWTDFLNTYPGVAELYFKIYNDYVGFPMIAAWAYADPEGYEEYEIGDAARKAVSQFPNENETEQTDQGYFMFIDGIAEIGGVAPPQVLNPDDPGHQPFIDIWLRIRDAIRDL
jgi:hypothetical protein